MSNPNTATALTSDNMDDLLSDLELDMSAEGLEDETVIEDIESEDVEVENEGDLAAVEALTEKEEAVASQTSEIEADASAVSAPAKTAKAPKTPKESKPKIERDLSAIADEFFQLDINGTADKAAVIALRPTQKKVQEKFDNLFASLSAGRKPSVYTMACFGVLVDKGEVTSTDLVAAMKAAASRSGGAYSDGTARSQVGQLMNLFGAVGIASRVGQKLTFNKDSKIAERLLAL